MHRASDGSGILRRSCISISTEPAEDTAYSTPGRPNHQYILSFNLCTYNGNISAQRWGADTTYHSTFNYTYDRLNRLINGTSTGTVAIGETLTYDVMGNINSMVRADGSLSKSGTYSYIGNRLTNISGGSLATGSYGYDANGNATIDGRAGVTLTYNHLNLPVTAGKTGLSLVYTYDAMGSKVKKVSTTTTTTTTDYVNGIQYTNGAIDFISTEEGKAVRNGTNFVYEYNLTDHLGNVRYVFNKHPTTGAIQPLQTSDYYPFGKRFGTGGVNNYLYNGKELQEELGQYDYGARFYDAEIGRWNSVDPLAEKIFDWTPYNYGVNNPVKMIDKGGEYAVSVHYELTYSTLRSMGYSKAEADKIAHYSSTYADHPSGNVLVADWFSGVHWRTYGYRKGINYDATYKSQDEANSRWHSMMSDAEADGGMTEKQAMNRGLKFGWDNVFGSNGGKDIGKLGQGIHALQDAMAHGGIKTSDHLGFNLSSVGKMYNDEYGMDTQAFKTAQELTKTAGIINNLLAGKEVKFNKDENLNLKGMSSAQFQQTLNLLLGAGFTGTITMK